MVDVYRLGLATRGGEGGRQTEPNTVADHFAKRQSPSVAPGDATGQLQGTNNTITVIQRTTYGYRDIGYFF